MAGAGGWQIPGRLSRAFPGYASSLTHIKIKKSIWAEEKTS